MGLKPLQQLLMRFVELPGWNPMFLRVADWTSKAKEALSKFWPWKSTVTQQAEVTMKGNSHLKVAFRSRGLSGWQDQASG